MSCSALLNLVLGMALSIGRDSCLNVDVGKLSLSINYTLLNALM